MKFFVIPSRLIALTASTLLFVSFFALRGDDDQDAANRAYTSGNYVDAAHLFQKIIDQRGYSASLCFDLANAEAQAGHTGDALLNYERARYLAPGDIDIDHNLQHARKLAGLDPNSYRWWQVALLSINWTVWLCAMGACLLVIFFALVGTAYRASWAARLKMPQRTLRNILRTLIFVAIPLCLLMGFVELSSIGYGNRIQGVIVASKTATLRLSPFDTADAVGVIPEGELVTVEDRHDDYLRIEGRDHHFGWIKLKDISPVVAGSFDVSK